MKYLEKSFTLPASQGITQEQWDTIWAASTDKKVVAQLASEGKEFDYEAIMQAKPPATESEHPVTDTVANGEYVRVRTDGDYPFLGSFDKAGNLTAAHCPNCHCKPTSYRHLETCVAPYEENL